MHLEALQVQTTLKTVFWNTCMFCGLQQTCCGIFLQFPNVIIYFTGSHKQRTSIPEGSVILCVFKVGGVRVRLKQHLSLDV